MMRTFLAGLMIVGGFALQAVSYFGLAAPLGRATAEAFSNPRVVFAPSLFIIGVVSVFTAALVYELLPEPRVAPARSAARAREAARPPIPSGSFMDAGAKVGELWRAGSVQEEK